MFCIKCQSEMEKTIFESIVVDYCSNCKAFWMDGGEFENALKEMKFDVEKAHKIVETESAESSIQSFHNGICPKCKIGKMAKVNKLGIDVDQCEECNGIFFDRGELQKSFDKENESFFVKVWNSLKNL